MNKATNIRIKNFHKTQWQSNVLYSRIKNKFRIERLLSSADHNRAFSFRFSFFPFRMETLNVRFEEIEKLIGSSLIEYRFKRELFRTRAPVLLTENRVTENWVANTISRA